MRTPIAWLRDYVELDLDTNTIVAKLAALGFPVDAVETRPHISGVVVGKIVKLEKHPNADRLQICTIDVAREEMLTIATAATNVAEGQIVPVATIGAQLPTMKIEPRKMRGIDSEGMLCSAEELGLPGEWFEDGIMQLDHSCRLGADVVKMFGLQYDVLDVDITPNRVDAMCMVGLARELGAALGKPVKTPETDVSYGGSLIGGQLVDDDGNLSDASFDSLDIRVTLESLDCRRYVVQRVSGIRVRQAKSWMRVRLALAGQRPINNVVDISNFVMLEVGQPLHFFDFAKIGGKHIIVRDARPGEHIVTLDGEERTLDATSLLIADETQATGLAGLKGGQISEVAADTRELVIESANWVGPRIRRMSVALGLRTDASTRNEKNLAIGLADFGAARAARLLEQEGATVHLPRGLGKTVGDLPVVALPMSEVQRLLGFTVSEAEVTAALHALGFETTIDGSTVRATVPMWRGDVTIAADLVEEVARIVGYERVPTIIPAVPEQTVTSDPFHRERSIASAGAALGFSEVFTLALQAKAVEMRWRDAGIATPTPVEIRNPLSEDQRYMRFSLLPAQLEFLKRDGAPRALFELGHVFEDAQPDPHDGNVATFVLARPSSDHLPYTDPTFLELKGAMNALVREACGSEPTAARGTFPAFHPGKTAELRVGDVVVGYVGVLDPRLAFAYELTGSVCAAVLFIDALPTLVTASYRSASRFPAIERDLALVLAPEVSAADITQTVRGNSSLVRDVRVFDEYRGPQIGSDKKSLAVRVTLQRDDATMTDAEADGAIAAILAALRERFGAAIRG